jgi:hypothetical protein
MENVGSEWKKDLLSETHDPSGEAGSETSMWDSDILLMARTAPFEYGLVRINVRYSCKMCISTSRQCCNLWHDAEMIVSLRKRSCAHGAFP